MCVDVYHMHSENGIFASDQFCLEYENKHQDRSLSGVGSHHKNARAERAIQTITYMARTFMVHSSLHLTDNGADDISLWYFDVNNALWLHNCLQN